jgi:hypothetical protein
MMEASPSIPVDLRAPATPIDRWWLRTVFSLCALVSLVLPLPVGAQAEPRPIYQISAVIDTSRAVVDVQESVAFTNWTGVPLSSIVFRLPPAEIGGVSLTRASATNQDGDATLSSAILEIPVKPPVQPGERVQANLAFSMQVPRRAGRLGVTPVSITLGNWFATLSVHRGDWDRRPYTDVGDAFFTEVADFALNIETVQPIELAFTGTLKQREGTRWSIVAENVRDVAIVGSSGFSHAQSSFNGVTVNAYALNAPAQRLADTAAEMLQWYSAHFSPYPFAEFRVVEAGLPASFGGMEYPGLIMLSTEYGPLQRGSSYDSLIAHEIAHQWFYSVVGNDQIDAAWVDEGLATYAPALFYQDVAPSIGRSQIQQIEASRTPGGIDVSLYAFSGDSAYFTAVYRPGARLMHEIRGAMGAETFDAALREYVSIHSHRIATPRALLDLLQRRTTANLNPIISRYVGYGAFSYPAPRQWSATLPSSTLSGSTEIIVDASFPIGQVEIWLDSQRLTAQELGGVRGARLELDLRQSAPGEHVLQARIWDDAGAQFEYDTRVTVK